MRKKYYILCCLLFCTTLLFAQSAKFVVTASKTQVYTNEQFEVDFTLNGGGDRFTPPSFSGFQVLEGPNESQSMTSVNGNTSYSTVYSYILAATTAGTYAIDPAAVVANGHTLTTSALRIKVIKGQAPQQQSPQQQAQAQAAQQDNSSSSSSEDLSKSLFIRADVDKTHVYQGEQLMVNYKVYTRVALLGSQMDKAPDLNGFWSQDIINKAPAVQWKLETYNGMQYNVATIKQTILFPEHAGDLVIDPLALTMVVQEEVRARSTDLFAQAFGNYKTFKYKIKSAPVIVHAFPLPGEGRPANFTGAVGKFSINANLDKKEMKANESLTYTVKISGTGNLNLLKTPVINPPADFEKYDPKVTDNITVAADGVSGSKEYAYLYIPRHEGNYTIDALNFSYFDPAAQKYVSLRAPAFPVKVNKGDAEPTAAVFNAADQEDVKLLGKDIRYIKTSAVDLYKDGEGFYNSVGYYSLLLLGPLLFGAAFFYRRWDDQLNSDVVKLKSRKANKIAAMHLAIAQKELKAGNKKAFYEAISRGLFGYLSDKLNIPVANLDRENIVDELKARSLDDATTRQLTDTMDLCEMARFAPVSGISEQEVFNKAKNTINEIEDKL